MPSKVYAAAELAEMHDDKLNDVMVGVMGWRIVFDRRQGDWRVRSGRCTDRGSLTYWCPASDWGSCGLVIKRMLKRGMTLGLSGEGASYCVPDIIRAALSKNPCRAICEAAVLATQAWREARRATKMKNPTAAWLREHGYDGLCLPGACGCVLDDLRPCSETGDECVPGYKGPSLEFRGAWAMYPTKEAADAARRAGK